MPERTVTFSTPWKYDSWLVDYSGPYNYDRRPQVQVVGYSPTIRSVHVLENLRANGTLIMWDVVGVTNNGQQAYFIVYNGLDAEDKVNDFR